MALLYSFYPLIIIIQAFCLYHAYRNGSGQKWYWIILFFPLIGGIIYLYEHFYSKKKIADLSEGMKGVMNSNYQLAKLEKKAKYSNTIANKTSLADNYAIIGRYDEAIDLYESCLYGFNKNDPFILSKLVEAHYLNKQFEKAVEKGNRIKTHKEFINSEARISYAQALYKLNKIDEATACFKDMDGPFSNYPHRMAYAYFLNEIDKNDKAQTIVAEMLSEFDRMDRTERKQKRGLNLQVNKLALVLKK